LVFWNYRGLNIRINDEILTVQFGRFDKKSFLLKDISSCKKTKSFGRYLGAGVRAGLDGSIAYIQLRLIALSKLPLRRAECLYFPLEPLKESAK